MGAKPAEVADIQTLKGYRAFWAAILTAAKKGSFTVPEIDMMCNAERRNVRDYTRRLEIAGYIKRIGVAEDQAVILKLVRPVKTAPRLRHDGSHVLEAQASDQMWRAMQMMPTFTKHDLVTWASTEDRMVRLAGAKDYIRHLHKAGYLQLVSKSVPGTAATYRLKKKMITGPLAPKIKRIKVVYDPNLKKIMWADPSVEVGDE